MGKRYSSDGARTKSETDAHGYRGSYRVLSVDSMQHLSSYLDGLNSSQIVIGGVPDSSFNLAGRVGDAQAPHTIARTKKTDGKDGCLVESAELAFAWIDADMDAAPAHLREDLQTPEQILNHLYKLVPALQGAAVLVRPSGSNGVLNPDGTLVKPARNYHIAFRCSGAERAALLQRLFDLMASSGAAWLLVTSIGTLLPKSFVDRAMLSQNQPVFAAPPEVVPPVRSERPAPLVREGRTLRLADVPAVDQRTVTAAYKELREAPETIERQRVAREAWVEAYAAQHLRYMKGPTEEQWEEARNIGRDRLAVLMGIWDSQEIGIDHEILLVDGRTTTPRKMYENPEKWVGELTQDPIETDYRGGGQRGKVFLHSGTLTIHSQAHGGRTYVLQRFEHEQKPGQPLFPKPAYVPFDKVGQDVYDGVLNRGHSRCQYHYGSQGTGKTTNAVEALIELGSGIQVIYQNNHRLLEQTAAQVAGRRPVVHLRGYEAKVSSGSKETMCAFPSEVGKMSLLGVDVAKRVCSKCSLKTACGMAEQRGLVADMKSSGNGIVLATAATLGQEAEGLRAMADLNVIDENAAASLLVQGNMNSMHITAPLSVPDFETDIRPTMLKVQRALESDDFREELSRTLVSVHEIVYVVQQLEDHIERAADKAAHEGMKAPPGHTGETPEQRDRRRAKVLEPTEFSSRLKTVQATLKASSLRQIKEAVLLLKAVVQSMESSGTPCITTKAQLDPETGEPCAKVEWTYFAEVGLNPEVPRIMLDGTGDQLLNEAVFGPADNFYNPVQRVATTVKVVGANVSQRVMQYVPAEGQEVQGRAATSARILKAISDALNADPNMAIVTNKDSVKPIHALVDGGLVDGMDEYTRALHFNAVAGSNRLKDFKSILVAGNALPGWPEVETMARAYACKLGVRITTLPIGDYGTTEGRNLRMRDGSVVEVECRVHPDPFVMRVARQFESQYDQGADRIRPHTCDEPKVIYDFTNSMINAEYDAVWNLDEFILGGQRRILALQRHGFFTDNKRHNHLFLLDLYPTKGASERELAGFYQLYMGPIGRNRPTPIAQIKYKAARNAPDVNLATVAAPFGQHIAHLEAAFGKKLHHAQVTAYTPLAVPDHRPFEERRSRTPIDDILFPFDATAFPPSEPED